MSAEDDTFDDIYDNDDQNDDQTVMTPLEPTANDTNNNADAPADGESVARADDQSSASPAGTAIPKHVTQEAEITQVAQPATSKQDIQPTHKRKASSISQDRPRSSGHHSQPARPTSPHATPALHLSDLHWWTTEETVRGFVARAGSESALQDLAFGEHKINGKSKGEVYLEFSTPSAASAVRRIIEEASEVKEEGGLKKQPFVAVYTAVGNPFKTTAGMGGKKEFVKDAGRGGGGAYQAFNNQPRGGFAGRGGRGGSGGYGNGATRGGNFNHANTSNGPNMNGYVNPMMAAAYGNGMGMPNFAARGGMMNMGMRGGFNPMAMGMGMGIMQGGGMMNGWGGRGGYGQGGGWQGSGYAGGGSMSPQQQQGQAGQGAKKMRTA